MLSSKWRRSPSHDKCSRRFCGSSRNYGRSHHPRQHEAFDCHAFKRNRQEECVQMPVKIARSTPRPSFGLRELLVASHISRLASRDAAKSLLSTLVSESSGECRFKWCDGYGKSSRQFTGSQAVGRMNHAETFFAAAAQICRDISFASIEALALELDRLRERKGRLFLIGVGGSAANCSHAVNNFRKLCGIETYS